MKRIIKLSFIVTLALLTGCLKEDRPVEAGVTGGDVWVEVPFTNGAFGRVDVSTKSDTGIIGESRVKNVFLFIFDGSNGKRLYAHFFDNRNIGDRASISDARFDGWWVTNSVDSSDPYGAYTPSSPDDSKWTSGGFHINAPSCTGAKLYALANIDGDMINVSPESLNLIRTESQLLALTAHMHPTNLTIQRNGYFPMTGTKSPIKIVGNKQKAQWYNGSAYTDDWYLSLERMDAKVHFNISVDVGHSSVTGSGPDAEFKQLMRFQPESWQVVNVPKGCSVFPTAGPDSAAAEEEGYFDSLAVPTETTRTDGSGKPVYGFTFYMMENRESARAHSSVSGDFHKRDLRRKDASGAYDTSGGRKWEYAPEYGTYVIIKGVLDMEVVVSDEAHDQNLCADVTYVVHLGDFGSDMDSYDIRRNTYYTYNMTIRGVNNIILEVSTSQGGGATFTEANPGAMGGVNIAKESTYTFDAHYGQRVFCFDADHIDPDRCFWYVKTPYGKEGIPPRVGDADIPSGFDYKWVHFRVNDPETVPSAEFWRTGYEKYPYKHNNTPYPGDDDPSLMDVVQFCLYLRQQTLAYRAGEPNDFRDEYDQEWYDWALRPGNLAAGESGGGMDPTSPAAVAAANDCAHRHRIYVTAYIDEFYYQEHPINPERTTPDFWKTFCNVPNRMMFLLCDSQFSLDRESSATGSVITIRQRSIQTPYNLSRNATDLPSGWGTEVVDETEGMAWFFSKKEHTYAKGSDYTSYANDIPNYASLNLPATYNSKASLDKCGRFNGRRNTVSNWKLLDASGHWVSGERWDAHLDYTVMDDRDYVFLKDDDENATMRWACLMRNRDNDGDGVIDPEEVRWYMASSEQIIGLYLGGLGLSEEAMSYNQAYADQDGTIESGPFAGTDKWRLHYISSTISYNSNNKKNLPDMIRAEEGPNIGPGYYHMDVYWDKSKKQGPFTMRCVRNLGMDGAQLDLAHDGAGAAAAIEDKNSFPTLLVSATPSETPVTTSTVYTFDCSNLNEKSIRYYSSVELEPENEFGYSARLWKRFETGEIVDLESLTGKKNGAQCYNLIYKAAQKGEGYCPEGYRTPNIREAAVMNMFCDLSWWGSATPTTLVVNWIYCGPSAAQVAGTSNYSYGGNGHDYASTKLGSELSKPTWVVKGNLGNISIGVSNDAYHYVRCVRDLP